MSILLDESQRAIERESRRVLAARIDRARLLPLLEQVDAIDDQFWATVVEQGWPSLAIPEEFGGLGLGLVELGIVAHACGAATSGAPFLALNDAVAQALIRFANRRLQEQWLPGLAAGTLFAAVAFGESAAILPPRPRAELDQNGRLSGAKDAVGAGLRANLGLVWAHQTGRPVLALAELQGVARTPVSSFDNSRLYARLVFEDTPATVLVEGADAIDAAHSILARMAVVTAHEQVGGAEALLFQARDYALTRKAFGQPIGAFQSVKHRIAELYGLVEIARANCIHAASRFDQPDFLVAAADARLSATEAYDTAARDATQIHGGIGVTWEAGLHLHMRRARTLAIEVGNAMFWEDLLVRELTGGAP